MSKSSQKPGRLEFRGAQNKNPRHSSLRGFLASDNFSLTTGTTSMMEAMIDISGTALTGR
jgi:hypothetical protein